MAKRAASYGLIIVAFDSEKKDEKNIQSVQVRDFNGFRDQEDVAIVLWSILKHANVNSNMVVYSHIQTA